MPMTMHPEIPFTEGDTVLVLDHGETRDNISYAHLIGEVGIVINPLAGSVPTKEDALVEVSFNGNMELMFHWRLQIIHKRVMWEI